MMRKEILSIRETAKILGCTEESVRCWIKDGSCPFGKQVVKNNTKKGKI